MGGPLQPPALFPAALLPKLETMTGDSGVRELAADALFLETGTDMLIDVDTAEDMARCTRLFAARRI